MPGIKTIILIFLIFFTLSLAAATSASADWFVNGTKLTAGATVGLAGTAKVDTPSTLHFIVALTSFKIVCKGKILRLEAPEIIGANEGKAKSLSFEQCETTEPATHCELLEQPATIKTKPVKIKATTGPKSPEDRITFSPATKINLAFFEFEESCPLKEFGVNGSVTMSAPTGQTETAAQGIEGLGSVENNSLEVAGIKVYLEGGRALLNLANASKWSFH